jgi:hypothetical protein
MITSFLLGVAVTFAEPAIGVLKIEVVATPKFCGQGGTSTTWIFARLIHILRFIQG